MSYPTDTTITTAGGVAVFEQSVMTRSRHPASWSHLVGVAPGAGAFTVEVMGAGGQWVELVADSPEADQVSVGRGFDQIRVTVTNAEAAVHLRTFDVQASA